jgi:hypothetical protein
MPHLWEIVGSAAYPTDHSNLGVTEGVTQQNQSLYSSAFSENGQRHVGQGNLNVVVPHPEKKKQIGINHTLEGIGCGHQPAGQVEGEQ